jgi:RNA polymerase sigma factor (sigma-70 family)
MTMQSTQSAAKATFSDSVDAALADPNTTNVIMKRIRYQTAKWYGAKRDLHDQVSQEVFSDFVTRIMEKKAGVDSSLGTTPIAWMLGFLPHILQEFGRKRNNVPAQQDELFDPPAKIEKQFNDIVEDLEYYLDCLDTDDRRLVTMFHMEQRSHREISVLLNLKYDAVRQRCSRAMQKMIDAHAQREGQS